MCPNGQNSFKGQIPLNGQKPGRFLSLPNIIAPITRTPAVITMSRIHGIPKPEHTIHLQYPDGTCNHQHTRREYRKSEFFRPDFVVVPFFTFKIKTY